MDHTRSVEEKKSWPFGEVVAANGEFLTRGSCRLRSEGIFSGNGELFLVRSSPGLGAPCCASPSRSTAREDRLPDSTPIGGIAPAPPRSPALSPARALSPPWLLPAPRGLLQPPWQTRSLTQGSLVGDLPGSAPEPCRLQNRKRQSPEPAFLGDGPTHGPG